MNILDVNVLLALYHPGHSCHPAATAWWQRAMSAGDPFAVPDLVWVGFTRLVTDRRVLTQPATFEQAWTFVTAVMAQPTYRQLDHDQHRLTEFARISRESGARANLVTDAYIAATASAVGGTVVTFDRDFRKFDGVRVHELERTSS